MLPLFFHEGPYQEGAELNLSYEESQHLTKVLRMKDNEPIRLFDGKGNWADVQIVNASPKGVKVKVETLGKQTNSRSRVTVAFGIPKGQALDFLVRRVAEIGVNSFQPLETHHSLRAKAWNDDRWDKVIYEVCKQCQGYTLPEILPPLALEDWLSKRDSSLLVYCDETDREAPGQISPDVTGVDLVIGPEGGWAPVEIEKLKAASGVSLGLGAHRLRAETAALVALVVVKKALREL